MPELPEVETIKLQLEKILKNKTITSVTLNLPKQVKGDKNIFLKYVIGAKIKKITRRAKMLIMELDNKYYLIFHLKMTGQLVYQNKQGKKIGGGHPLKEIDLPHKHSHIILNFTGQAQLFFNDIRQFGWLKLVDKKELEKILADFGPEPLAKDFNFKRFLEIFSHKKKAIKPLLMEQNLLAGVGNIYAIEACYCAGILPTRPANKIKQEEYKKLYQCLRKILQLAIKKNGTSSANYVDAFGNQGQMNRYLQVYGQAGEKCIKCKSIIKNIKQSGRTTSYCSKCQS